MNVPDPLKLQVQDRLGLGLHIVFQWHVDRYAHNILVEKDGRLVPLLASLEDTDNRLWPPSPPIQQANLQEYDGQPRVILGLGMAGKSHWSMSVEVRPDPPSISFDVACRVREKPGPLVSSYRSMVPATRFDGDRVAMFELASQSCRIELDSASDATVALDITETGLAIVVHPDDAAVPGTFRWQYRVSMP